MRSQQLIRELLALFCALQGAGTLALDLNRTHAAHPQWIGHARFHLVWQATTTALLAVIEVILLLSAGPLPIERFYLAALLASLPVAGFFIALATRRIYAGMLHDPKGIPPLIVSRRGSKISIDLNLVVEVIAALLLSVLVGQFHRVRAN